MGPHHRRTTRNVLICRSNPVAPDPRVAKVAACLADAGYRITVVGWDRDGILPKSEYVGTEKRFQITRLFIPGRYGQGIRNMPALLRWQWRLLIWLIKRRREYDIVHACDFDTVLPALLIKWAFKKKVIYDIFDFYADHLRSTPQFFKKLIRKLDIWAINKVDAVILADEARKRQVLGANPRRLEVIYNTPEENQGIGQEPSEPPAPFSVVYIGLLQIERGLIQLIEVFKKHPEWRLILAGYGGDEELIQKRAKGLGNVSWHGRVNYENAIKMSSEADTFVATYDPVIPNHRYSSPNKMFEAMMLGKPIIVAENTNMDKIVKKWEMGLIVKYGDLSNLERALITLFKDKELRKQMGKNAREAYDKEYSWGRMQKRLLDMYHEVEMGDKNCQKYSL